MKKERQDELEKKLVLPNLREAECCANCEYGSPDRFEFWVVCEYHSNDDIRKIHGVKNCEVGDVCDAFKKSGRMRMFELKNEY